MRLVPLILAKAKDVGPVTTIILAVGLVAGAPSLLAPNFSSRFIVSQSLKTAPDFPSNSL